MPNDDHPFDRAMEARARKRWEEVERLRTPRTPAEQDEIEEAIRQSFQRTQPARKQRTSPPRFIFWFLGLGFAAFAVLLSLPSRGPEVWRMRENAGGSKGTSTNESALALVMEKEWIIVPDFKLSSIEVSFDKEAHLRGELKNAPELNSLKLENHQFYRLSGLTNTNPAELQITGSGVLDLQSTTFEKSQNPTPHLKEVERAILKLELQASGISHTGIRKIEKNKQ